MDTNGNRSALNGLRMDLHRAGLRATPSRLAVLKFLRDAGRPLSHADVVASFARQTWDRSTLYRNLNDLVDAGLARKTELGDRVWRFVDASQHTTGDHPHFVCTECGRIQCLPNLQVQLRPAGRGPQAVRRRQFEVHVRGRCDDCR